MDELLHITRILCKNMSQVRIDFYIIEGKIYFGEITFHTASGFQKMIPESLDFELGKVWNLEITNNRLKEHKKWDYLQEKH